MAEGDNNNGLYFVVGALVVVVFILAFIFFTAGGNGTVEVIEQPTINVTPPTTGTLD